MDDLLRWLQDWYSSQCDGDWEHAYGISIESLDNPGWRLEIDLAETHHAGAAFDRIEWHRSEDEWLVCWLEEEKFHAACGPHQLTEAIAAFRNWIEQH